MIALGQARWAGSPAVYIPVRVRACASSEWHERARSAQPMKIRPDGVALSEGHGRGMPPTRSKSKRHRREQHACFVLPSGSAPISVSGLVGGPEDSAFSHVRPRGRGKQSALSYSDKGRSDSAQILQSDNWTGLPVRHIVRLLPRGWGSFSIVGEVYPMRSIIIAAAATLSIAAVPASVQAAPCKDAKGKFVKCPPAAAKVTVKKTMVKKAPCRDAKGRFTKCK